MRLIIDVPGTPQSKGSRTQIGKANIEAGTTLSRKRKKAWRDAVVREATEAMLAITKNVYMLSFFPIVTACSGVVTLYFPIPKSRMKGKRKIQPGSPHTQKPDCDKALRAILDPLKDAGIVKDDCIVSTLQGRKIWCDQGDERAVIEISW